MALKFFPIRDKKSQIDQAQSRLMILAALIMITIALTLTISPSVRYRADHEFYQYKHWIGLFVWIIAFSALHHQSSRQFPSRDQYLLPIFALLSGIGLMTVWRLYPNLGLRQTIWLALASLLVWLGMQFPTFLDYLRRYKYIWLISGLLLTALTIILGSNPSGFGSTRWLRLFGLHFQPSEPLKLILIIYLAGFFTDRVAFVQTKIQALLPTIFVTGSAILILFFQRDLGSASILMFIYLAMLFTTQENELVLWLTPIVVFITGLIGYYKLDIVQLRIDTWLNPFSDPLGASYQIIQSMIAIAEGGLIGAGLGLGSPGLVPVSVSDFIFAAIAEELGFLGVMALILLIIILLYRGTKVATLSQTSFHRYLSIGLVFYFGIQSILIIGGNIGLIPLTGVTLPLVSYGGSSLVVSFIALLLFLTISHHTTNPATLLSNPPQKFSLLSGAMIAMLVLEILATSFFSFWFKPSLVSRPENPRWIIADRFRPRGNILDRNNQAIITNKGEAGAYQRISNYIPLTPIIGYTSPTYGQTGIESSMFAYLRGNEGYPFKTTLEHALFFNQPPDGLDVRLTIDLQLQQTADSLLESVPASIVLMNANTGEILVMASHPYFDATNLQDIWADLIADKRAPLLNRASQGMYPPGATLLPFIMTHNYSLFEENPNPEDMLPVSDRDLNCALPASKPYSWQGLISNGCVTIQANLEERIGKANLLGVYQNFGLFSKPAIRLSVAEPESLQLEPTEGLDEENNLFRISPLQMAIASSVLTNQGILPGPSIVDAYKDPDGSWITLPKLGSNNQAVALDVAFQVTNLLQESDSPHWQVAATATTADGQPVSWFIAGTTVDWIGPPITVVVLLEADDPGEAVKIGRTLLNQYFTQYTFLDN